MLAALSIQLRMKGSSCQLTYLTLLTLCSVFQLTPLSSASVVTVATEGNCTGSCQSLDMALQSIQSNTVLQLMPGTHTVRTHYNVTGRANLTIQGDPNNSSSVVIECEDSLGLIFMEIQGLTITGVVVQNCGFTEFDRASVLFTSIKQSIAIFFKPLDLFSTGMMLVDIRDLVMENTIIQENQGFGLVGINVIGNSKFLNVNFISNHPGPCHFTLTRDPGGSGGGLNLLYYDYVNNSRNTHAENSTIVFNRLSVKNNYNCQRDFFSVNYNLLPQTLGLQFTLNNNLVASGGISIALSQSNFTLSPQFENCSFVNNTGLYLNSAMSVVIYNPTQASNVSIKDCEFTRNGGLFFNKARSFPENGLDPFGALIIGLYVPLPNLVPGIQPSFGSSNVLIENCTFTKNKGLTGGGLIILALSTAFRFIENSVTIKDCLLRENSGNFGSAIFMTELGYSAFEAALKMTIDSIKVEKSYPLINSSTSSQFDVLSAIDFNNIRVDFIGSNSFSGNDMTAMYITNTILVMTGNINFTDNKGVTGGALHMERESYLVFADQTELVFANNHALVSGGAMFVDFRATRSIDFDCWLFFEEINPYCDILNTCSDPSDQYNITIKLLKNVAPLGSTMYGDVTLSQCPWNKNGLNFSQIQSFPNLSYLDLVFEPPLSDENTINTFALSLVSNSTDILFSEPGQQFSIPLNALDRLNQPVPLTIFSVTDDVNEAQSTIGSSNSILLPGDVQSFTDVPLRVNATEDSNLAVMINSNEALLTSAITLKVKMRNCSRGFIYSNESRGCECEIDKFLTRVTCLATGKISYDVNDWIGIDEVSGFYVRRRCIRDYCENGVSIVNLSEPNTQCRNNRAGLLCGECAEGFSRVLGGGTQCEVCDNNSYLSLIVLFAAFGILLFIFMATFDITITDGYINSFIFFANIFSVYTSNFIPITAAVGLPPIILISFLNLNFGISSCFHDGLSELELVGLTLIFPIYLGLILLCFALFGKFVSHERVSNFYMKIKITHIFATLLFICYASLMETCVAILAFVIVRYNDDTGYNIRWGRNPTILYGQNGHGILLAVSCFLLVIFIPLPIVLLNPRIAYRSRYIRSLKPIIDAFIAPFAPGKEYWISLRLMFRVVIYFIAAIGVTSDDQLLAMQILITCLAFLHFYLKPFKGDNQNTLDGVLMAVLAIFSSVALFLFDGTEFEALNHVAMVLVYVLMYIFLILFLLLLTHYVLKRFEMTNKPYARALELIDGMLKRLVACNYCDSKKKESNKDNANVDMATDGAAAGNPVTCTSISLEDISSPNVLRRETLLNVSQPNTNVTKKSTRL